MGSGEGVRMAPGWGGLPTEAEEIWARAERAMSVPEPGGAEDVFLWEHSRRVVTAIPLILQILGRTLGEEPDRLALFAAALYHDAGWIAQVRDATISRWDILARPTSDLQRELGAELAREHLADRLPASCLETVGAAIRGLNTRAVDLLEARILAEADYLDEIGPMAFWLMVRLNASKGRGIEACVDAWHSQQEYHFWEAKLDRFRFEATRKLAEKRLQALDQFVRSVASLSRGEDLLDRVARLGRGRTPTA